MTIDSKSLTVFFRNQGIYLFIALLVDAIFWAFGQPINPFTVIATHRLLNSDPHRKLAPRL